jgi:hypothetical protein
MINSAADRKQRRKEEKSKEKKKLAERDENLIAETGMFKKKEREKLVIARKIKYNLPPTQVCLFDFLTV